jgi:hypothetical protein
MRNPVTATSDSPSRQTATASGCAFARRVSGPPKEMAMTASARTTHGGMAREYTARRARRRGPPGVGGYFFFPPPKSWTPINPRV